MSEVMEFKLCESLEHVTGTDYKYICVMDKEIELALVVWIDDKNNLCQEEFDLLDVQKNFEDKCWVEI